MGIKPQGFVSTKKFEIITKTQSLKFKNSCLRRMELMRIGEVRSHEDFWSLTMDFHRDSNAQAYDPYQSSQHRDTNDTKLLQ